ncbi:kinase-like domain, phloem protein 2-like protein, partial [Tanacetum coccineum]
FPKVAEVFDISNLMIEIKIRTQFLSPGVNYKVNLIFRFWGPRKTKSFHKPMYVDFKYKMGGENLHAYFATWRDDGWMMLELCRFLCYKEDTNFEVLLESFSRCYSGSRTFYVELEGIEFQAIDNASLIKPFGSHCRFFCLYNYNRRSLGNSMQVMKYEDIESIEEVNHVEIGLKKVQQFLISNSKREKQKSMLSEMNRKKQDMVIEVKDHIIRKVNEKKDHLVSKVSTKKDRLLSRVNRKKDRLVSRVNRVKDHLVSAKDVLHGFFNEELNLTPSAQSRFAFEQISFKSFLSNPQFSL